MSEQKEIQGKFLREYRVFQNEFDRVIIGHVKLSDGSEHDMKGPADEGALIPGLTYRFWGHWTHHERYGRQFQFQSFVTESPLGEAAVVTYLSTQCKGIGTVLARRIYDSYRDSAIQVLRETPEEVSRKIRGLTVETAKAASLTLSAKIGTERATAALMGLIHGYGFLKSTVGLALKKWGSKAADVIRKNPYHLLEFPGCGFLKVDQLYLKLGKPPGTLKRQALCGEDAIRRKANGNTWVSLSIFQDALLEKISGTRIHMERAIELARRARLISIREEGSTRWLASRLHAFEEQTVAERAAKIVTDTNVNWTPVTDGTLSEQQLELVSKAFLSRIGILAGRPGTGKTYTTAQVIKAALQAGYGPEDIAVAAPTGKAAQRLTQALDAAGVPITARTIHSLLYSRQTEHFEQKFLFIDESSMLDTSLASELFNAIGPETHVLLIGDIHQLPPVGHGAPLRDFIAAGVPCGELTEIRRNSGRIVSTCSEIVDHHRYVCSKELNLEAGENLIHIESTNENSVAIEELITRYARLIDIDPLTGVQVIVATNKRRRELNRQLQAALNPSGMQCKGTPFRVGDKVINLKNSQFELVSSNDDDFNDKNLKVPVANGEQGIVLSVSPGQMIVRLDARNLTVLVRWRYEREGKADDKSEDSENGSGCSWDLGYAISGHKSQGSEWPIAIVIVEPAGAHVQTRQWVYTAISRAKTLCLTVGSMQSIQMAMKTDGVKRKTFLKENLQEEVAKIKRRKVASIVQESLTWDSILEDVEVA